MNDINDNGNECHEKYESCVFDSGSLEGTPEEAFDTSFVYLME